MNAFKTLFLSALLVSTGVLADSSTHTGSLKNQASQQAEKYLTGQKKQRTRLNIVLRKNNSRRRTVSGMVER
ncbi:TPA: hypothetical protein ACIAB4_005628 [Escherichia coli]